MKNIYFAALLFFISLSVFSQNFTPDSYLDYRKSIIGLNQSQLKTLYPTPSEFYVKGFQHGFNISKVHYLDSVILKLELTKDELDLLKQNHFFVTERLSYQNFGHALHSVYNYDLPVFVSTDAILHALHMSYDQILKSLEREIMAKNLEEFLASMYHNFDNLTLKYGESPALINGLSDADLYVTIAYSLIKNELQKGRIAKAEKIKEVWEAIRSEKMVSMPLFTFPHRSRNLDFSQFTVRGHYVYTEQEKWQRLKSLEPYFRTMMWLGRTDFLLTTPPENPWEKPWTEEEIQRMHVGAFMVNELLQKSEKLNLLQFNEQVINYLVGESDNITPSEYQTIMKTEGITSALQFTDTTAFNKIKLALNSNSELAQQILSDFYLMDPQGDAPGELPISYRVSGQRFIIDSYVLGSVVFDKLMYKGQKIMRMMPIPLDALFTLGNNDALPLLKRELEKYPYAEQLANLRYIMDHKPEEFWSGSLYNVWLNSIRELNPADEELNQPLFMKTAAWHQEKINTQLASWSQLRHDNLLYAKQSYTGGTGCSFPYSYIEPYPEFYGRLKEFAQSAGNFFAQLPSTNYELSRIVQFFPNFETVMAKLETLSDKQLKGSTFTDEENDWLKSMLFVKSGSGMPPYTGWYSELFYDAWDISEGDFTIVDVHTQPTDEMGNVVGRVLHTGVGEVNLGVFLANCPFEPEELMAFTGPVLSYYEKITENFKRLTDQEWETIVQNNEVPNRPEWTNIYLAGKKGETRLAGTELPSKLYTGAIEVNVLEQQIKAYPNPVSDLLSISFRMDKNDEANIFVFNSTGIMVKQSGAIKLTNGSKLEDVPFHDLPAGLYVVKVAFKSGNTSVLKIIKK